MGANVSIQENVSISDIVNNNLTQISNDINSGIITTSSSNQTFNINARGIYIAGDFNASQKTDIAMSAILNTNNDLSTTLANKVSAEIEKKLKNDLEQVNKDLNVGQANIGITSNVGITKTTTNLNNLIKTGINNTVKSDAYGTQMFNIDIEYASVGGNVNLGQESQIKTVAKSISENIAQNAIQNVSTVIDKAQFENVVKQKNAGIDIMAFASMFMVGVIFIGGGVIYMTSSAKSMISKGISLPITALSNAPNGETVGGGIEDMIDTIGSKNFIGILVAIVVLLLIVQYKIYIDWKEMKQNTYYAEIIRQKGMKPPFTIFNYIL